MSPQSLLCVPVELLQRGNEQPGATQAPQRPERFAALVSLLFVFAGGLVIGWFAS